MRCLREISIRSPLRETSQRPLRNISEKMSFCDVFKTSQKHLKKDAFCVTSLRRLEHISKRCLFRDVSVTSQNHLSEKFVIFQKYPTKMVLFDFRRVITISDKIDVGAL